MIIFDLKYPNEAIEAAECLAEFSRLEKKVEIKLYSPKRSNPQNRALHLLLGYLSSQTGYTLEESKELYKNMNRGLYKYTKPTIDGEGIVELTKSSSKLTEAEMAKSIDKLYKVCGENGIELPLLTNEAEMRSIEKEIAKDNHFN